MNISEIYIELKEGCICVLLSGSAIYSESFHIKPRDFDYVFIYDTLDNLKAAKRKFHSTFDIDKLKNEDHIDIHFKIEQAFYTDYGDINLIKYIIGPSIYKSKPDILDNKEYYLNICKRYCSELNGNYKTKKWYHIYRIIEVIKNNSYTFNSEQIRIFNLLHDVEYSEEKKQIIDKLINNINNL